MSDPSTGAPPGDSRVVLRAVGQVFGSGDRRVEALVDVELTIDPGELVCIVGPSGCGKTTLLQIVAGFVTPTHGEVTVGDALVRGPGPDRGVVFQQPNLYPWLTVRSNVAFGPRMRRVPRRVRNAEADRLLALVGLDEFAEHRPYELSGGMQQRCQIARVLASDPAIMLMDEPFGALDALTRERMQLELRRLWSETGKTIVFITHSVEEAVFLGTRVLVMSPRPGRVVFDEPSPLGARTRDRAIRTDADFVTFRERIAGHIDANGDGRDPGAHQVGIVDPPGRV